MASTMKAWRTYKYNEDVPAAMFVSIANFTPAPENYTNVKFVNMILKSDGDDLKKMVALAEAGKLKCIIDEHFAFDKVPEALSKSLTARSGGKLVIDVA